ncbi:MAG: zinc ribbon domain-containing protein [Gemmatimonadetes bacterium]|nr:zinc ribbon domain-containing protein [Gemmatimonadota bacterium]
MPIYEYNCEDCGEAFELLIRGEEPPTCPSCDSERLEKLLSLPRIHSEGRKQRSLTAAKKRDAALGSERVRAQREYELNHDDH